MDGVRAQPEAACRQRLRPVGRRKVWSGWAIHVGWALDLRPLRTSFEGGLQGALSLPCLSVRWRPNEMLGVPRCMSFAGQRIDTAVARELIRAVEPMAIEAALTAERMHMEGQREQQRILELELAAGPLRGLARRAALRRLRPGQPLDRRPTREELGGDATPRAGVRGAIGDSKGAADAERQAGLCRARRRP